MIKAIILCILTLLSLAIGAVLILEQIRRQQRANDEELAINKVKEDLKTSSFNLVSVSSRLLRNRKNVREVSVLYIYQTKTNILKKEVCLVYAYTRDNRRLISYFDDWWRFKSKQKENGN